MKELKEPILVIVVIFIIIGFAYQPLNEGKLKVSKEDQNSPSSAIGTGTVAGDTDKKYTEKEAVAELKKAESDLKKLQKEIDEKAKEKNRSPYYEKITISNFSSINSSDPSKEYFSLSTRLKDDESVNITGWYLKSEVTGYGVVIGKASLLPFPFTKTETDVILKTGDRAIVNKGFSPIGISFRTNKCTGYLAEDKRFTPSIPKQCPIPSKEKLPVFSTDLDRDDECIEIIESIPRCTTVGNSFLRDLPDTVTKSCKNYISTQINYNSCVSKHYSDTDFAGHDYRIYLNKFGPLWRTRQDTINLYDQNGLIVDTVSW